MTSELENIQMGIQNLCLSTTPSCANNSESAWPCQNPGSFACKDCLLVAYCGQQCQTIHWHIHKKDCRSPSSKKTWMPSWMVEGREPDYKTSHAAATSCLEGKSLWSNVPALDIIKLKENERNGPPFLYILFPTSHEIKDAILSVVNLPESSIGLDIVINDIEIDIVARNVIFLLVFFFEENPITAAECVLHIWYSAFIKDSCHSILQNIKSMIRDVYEKIKHAPDSVFQSKTWSLGNRSLRLVLTRGGWFSLLSRFSVSECLTKDEAQRFRHKALSSRESIDWIESDMCAKSPPERIGEIKFQNDGILLPFAQSRGEFTVPNPTLFHQITEWPIKYHTSPLNGWSPRALQEYNIGPIKNDLYGKLYHYLRSLFANFHQRIRSLHINFELLNVDAGGLLSLVGGRQFDRIYAKYSIDEDGNLDGAIPLSHFTPLLQPTSINCHATLITRFGNALIVPLAYETSAENFDAYIIELRQQKGNVLEYMPELSGDLGPVDSIKLRRGRNLFRNLDKLFTRYANDMDLAEWGSDAGFYIKDKNTIIDQSLCLLRNGRLTKEEKEYFALLISLGVNPFDWFVEWASKINVEQVY